MSTASSCCCAVCGRMKDVLRRCVRCKSVFYCSKECQIEDWSSHKKICLIIPNPCQNTNSCAILGGRNEAVDRKTSGSTCEIEQGTPPVQYKAGEDHCKDIWVKEDLLQHRDEQLPLTTTKTADRYTQHSQSVLQDDFDEKKDTHFQDGSGFTQRINFPKAVNDIQGTRTSGTVRMPHGPETSGAKHVLTISHRDVDDDSQPKLAITVKANKKKHRIFLLDSWTDQEMINHVSSVTEIPTAKLKLIHKGKLVTGNAIGELARKKAPVFQAIGEKAESEEGLETRDIEVLMEQLHIERNEAVRALRQTGDVIDAILLIGNK